ncbi:hypothetical protein NPX13_g6988 [Xylaria arbuscula]|uniref:Uncharacterized protein n=1 Tax=Xylaria arbuscula TaxID=114810 RepID=A0A9W8NBT8_9PEZI|nr:hypothetical protein NPX13_g6988 [Xylaria arbuscula]
MTVRHAEITDVVAPGMDASSSSSSDLVGSLKGLHLHRIEDWRGHVGGENESMGRWLNERFGISNKSSPTCIRYIYKRQARLPKHTRPSNARKAGPVTLTPTTAAV